MVGGIPWNSHLNPLSLQTYRVISFTLQRRRERGEGHPEMCLRFCRKTNENVRGFSVTLRALRASESTVRNGTELVRRRLKTPGLDDESVSKERTAVLQGP